MEMRLENKGAVVVLRNLVLTRFGKENLITLVVLSLYVITHVSLPWIIFSDWCMSTFIFTQ